MEKGWEKIKLILKFRILVEQQAQRKEEKWRLPVPCIPPQGLSEKYEKILCQKRDCANQIHKVAMAINSNILAELQVPESYIASLPKVAVNSVLWQSTYVAFLLPPLHFQLVFSWI